MFEKPCYVYCSVAALAVAVMIFARAVANKFPGRKPPVFEEIPFIGGLLGFISSPIELGKRGHQAVGEVGRMENSRQISRSIPVLLHIGTTAPLTLSFRCLQCLYYICG